MSDVITMSNWINDAIFVSLVNTALQMTVLIPLIALFMRILRIKSATTRHSLWLFALFAVVALPLLTPFIPRIDFTGFHHQRGAGYGLDDMMRSGMGASDAGESSEVSGSVPSTGAAKAALDREVDVSLINPVSIAYFIWCAGALLMLCVTIGVYVKLRKLRIRSYDIESKAALDVLSRLRGKPGIRRTVALKVSSEVYIPMGMGILSPVIILPDSVMDGESSHELEMILAHELAHIRRCDYLVRFLQNVLGVVFFFHPLFHLMKRNLAREREHICDDWVIDVTRRRSEYAECLVGLLEKAIYGPVNIPVTLAMAERKRDIPGRVDMIVDRTRKTATKISRKALIIVFLIGCLSLPVIGGIELVGSAGARAASGEGTIVFARKANRVGSDFEIYAMNPDGSNLRKLTDNFATDWFPSISPDGTKIAFSRQPRTQEGRDRDVWVMDANGKNERKVGDWGWCTSWSPDGTRIVFGKQVWEQKDGEWEVVEMGICVMNADGSNLETLLEGDFITPAWSPDGTKIAFARYWPDREEEVWVMDADGQNEKRLTKGKFPCWSPDGSKIVFQSYRDGWSAWQSADIYVMDADGGNVERLTEPGPADDCHPAWSPDGKKIAFRSREEDDPTEIYVMEADGSNVKNLTDTPDWEWSLCWTPHSLSYAVEPAGKLRTTWGRIKALLRPR